LRAIAQTLAVKLLLDENPSHKLVKRLSDLYPDSAHVVGIGLMASPVASPEREIWNFAKSKRFIIVSIDANFYELATTITASQNHMTP